MPSEIDLIYTRDFGLATNEFWQGLLSKEVAMEFGMGVPNQIARFTGRTVEFYRLKEEVQLMKSSVLAKPETDYLFSEVRTYRFKICVNSVRELIKQSETADADVNKQKILFKSICENFSQLYPMYMLAIIMPNYWKEDFLKSHAEGGVEIIERTYNNRVYSEGLLKELDFYFRVLLKKILSKNSEFYDLLAVISFTELKNLVENNKLPELSELKKRLAGYIYYQNNLLLDQNFAEFLQKHDLSYTNLTVEADQAELKGQVASLGGIVRATAQVIMNSEEIKLFKLGNILITPMTSPDYLDAIKKAGAVVTDEGGVTCHAAIVSREFKIPCVIGTKFATKIFKDGDMVEVDAKNGVIKKID